MPIVKGLESLSSTNSKVNEKGSAKPDPIIHKEIKPPSEAYQRAIRELTHANLRLRQLDKAKDEFISIASHELRNPMAIIKGNISMILTGDSGEVNPEIRDVLTDMMLAVERQIRLVNELLDISRIEAGVINFNLQTTIQLEQVAKLLNSSLQSIANDQNIELKIKTPEKPLPHVQADHDKLSQVLINLVTNAMKFTSTGAVTIEVKQKDDFVQVCVVDTGAGIPEKQKDLLFKKFSKATAPTSGTMSAGSGLGLYISKKYIEKQGGNIWLEKSKPGYGSTFCFTLPITGTKKAKEVAEDIKSLQPIKNIHFKEQRG